MCGNNIRNASWKKRTCLPLWAPDRWAYWSVRRFALPIPFSLAHFRGSWTNPQKRLHTVWSERGRVMRVDASSSLLVHSTSPTLVGKVYWNLWRALMFPLGAPCARETCTALFAKSPFSSYMHPHCGSGNFQKLSCCKGKFYTHYKASSPCFAPGK